MTAGRCCYELTTYCALHQAELALELGLPLNVHSRAAGHHAITLLKEVGAANSCVMHAFDGKAKYAVDAVRSRQ